MRAKIALCILALGQGSTGYKAKEQLTAEMTEFKASGGDHPYNRIRRACIIYLSRGVERYQHLTLQPSLMRSLTLKHLCCELSWPCAMAAPESAGAWVWHPVDMSLVMATVVTSCTLAISDDTATATATTTTTTHA